MKKNVVNGKEFKSRPLNGEGYFKIMALVRSGGKIDEMKLILTGAKYCFDPVASEADLKSMDAEFVICAQNEIMSAVDKMGSKKK